jgi:hypothetical protein
MRYPLEKLFGCCFLIRVYLIRHFVIWGTLNFMDLRCIWLSKVNGPALPKERWIKVDKALPEKNG